MRRGLGCVMEQLATNERFKFGSYILKIFVLMQRWCCESSKIKDISKKKVIQLSAAWTLQNKYNT